MKEVYIHETAEVSEGSSIGYGTKVLLQNNVSGKPSKTDWVGM